MKETTDRQTAGSTASPEAEIIPAPSRLWLALALLTVYVIWGSTYLAIRFAVATFPPLLMASLRYTVAGLLLYGFLRARGAPGPRRDQWIGSLIVGGLLLALGNGGVSYAEKSVVSGVSAIMIGTVPLWAALFARIWGQWPTRWEIVGLGLGFSGVALLNVGSDLRAHPIGAIILLVAAISWALGSVWSQHLSLPSGAIASATEMLAGGALLLVAGLATGERVTSMPTAKSTWAILYLIVFGSLIAFTAYSYLLHHARPAIATSYAYINPAVAVGLGVILGGERLTPVGLVALIVILTGVALVVSSRART